MQISLGTFAKRRNSTKQPASFTDVRTVNLKEGTSVDRPTFILTGDIFDYNYVIWGTKYYFITDIVSLHNGLTEVSCVLDVLATYKTEILASTQYVCYSSQVGNNYLVDTRIPTIEDKIVRYRTIVNPKLSRSGNYVLAVNGENGCCIYKCSLTDLQRLIQDVSVWQQDAQNAFLNNLIAPGGDIVQATENLYTVLARAGAFGNAFSEAPAQIRSCIWVPFDSGAFNIVNSNKQIYLGQFPTAVLADEVSATPYMETFSGTDIPWNYSDYRRATCEHLYMYLPFVGLVPLATDNLIDETHITIKFSIMPVDGSVAYELSAGEQIIGTYGGQCSANFPIGISQQASSGEIINSILSGAESMVNAAINSSISPISMTGSGIGVALEGVKATYDTVQVANSRHNTTVGGIGGGVGSGLDLSLKLFNVIDKTIVEPVDMAATMGRPTMKPISLGTLTGFCQCANAHVEAAAQAEELDALDAYLNTGFYIE